MCFKMKKRIFILLLVVLGVLSIFLAGSVVVLFFGYSSEKNQNNEKIAKKEMYQISNFNTLTNETTIGIVTLTKRLSPNGFLSYRSSDKTIYSAISKFMNSKFECYGKCSCGKRRSISVASKSLYFVVSAISVVMAVNIAKNFFHEQCLLAKLSDDELMGLKWECEDEDVESDVEYCEKKKEKVKDEVKDKVDENEGAKLVDEENFTELNCMGHCVDDRTLEHEIAKLAQQDMECEELWIEGKVSVKDKYPMGFYDLEDHFSHQTNIHKVAQEKFRIDILRAFCKKESEHTYEFTKRFEKEQRWEKQENTASLCTEKGKFKGVLTNNVFCSEEPKLAPETVFDF